MGSSRSTRMVIATVCSLVLVLIQLGLCTEVDYNTGTAGWENASEASAYSSDSSNINYLPQERNQYGQGVLTPLSKDLSGSSTLGTLFSEDEDPIYAAEHFPKRKYRRRRRKNKLKKKKRPVLEYYDDYDSEYYDRDDVLHGYFASKDDGYSAPRAPSYESAPSYNAPSYGGDDDGFNDFLNALAAFLPIGLFLAAIPPNLITISTKKKRSIQSNEVEQDNHQIDQEEEKATYPFINRILHMGIDEFWNNPQCQQKIYCEMSQMGHTSQGNWVQKSMAFATIMFPTNLMDIIDVAKNGDCNALQCQ